MKVHEKTFAKDAKPFPSADVPWLVLLWAAALLLYWIDLGGVPLRDWDEGTVAQVAREISRSTDWSGWLHPQIWGEPYLNKPPLLHSLIAGTYNLFGVHNWTARFPGACFTASSVPLLYLLGREIFPRQRTALLGAGVYLLLLPVARHGRLAMLDGTVVFFFIALLWMAIKARRNQAWYLGVGLSFAGMCLTKGILGLLLLAVALLFMIWDRPRAFRSPYLWAGLGLGSVPVLGWYVLQWQYYGEDFIDKTVLDQNFGRIWVDNRRGSPWFYLQEILENGWPWLIFWPVGFWLTWQRRSQTWAKLLLVWTIVYFFAVTLMGTKLPWYIYPIYPAIALTIGVALAAAWNLKAPTAQSDLALKAMPKYWGVLLGLFSVAGIAGTFYASPWGWEPSLALALTFSAIAVATGWAAIWVFRQNRRFIPTLMVGLYVALLAFMTSHDWLWELNETFPVMPVAELINQSVPADAPIYMAYWIDRSSLNFYCDRHIPTGPLEALMAEWQQGSPVYLLVEDPAPFRQVNTPFQDLGTAAGWHLIVNAG